MQVVRPLLKAGRRPEPVRVTAGRLKGRPLRVPRDADFRATTAAHRALLFNVLRLEIEGARFLDLFAGSGAVGFEALSRGAAFAVFVERERGLSEAIEESADALAESGRVLILQADAEKPDRLPAPGRGPFDIVFMDPPYALDPEPLFAPCLPLLVPGGVLAVEHSSRRVLNPVPGLVEAKVKTSGDTAFTFFVKEGG